MTPTSSLQLLGSVRPFSDFRALSLSDSFDWLLYSTHIFRLLLPLSRDGAERASKCSATRHPIPQIRLANSELNNQSSSVLVSSNLVSEA